MANFKQEFQSTVRFLIQGHIEKEGSNYLPSLSLFSLIFPIFGLIFGLAQILLWWAMSQHLSAEGNYLPMIPILLVSWFLIVGRSFTVQLQKQESDLTPVLSSLTLVSRFCLLVYLLEQNLWVWILIAPFISRSLILAQLYWRQTDQGKIEKAITSRAQLIALVWICLAMVIATVGLSLKGVVICLVALLGISLLFRKKEFDPRAGVIEAECLEILIFLSLPF